MKEFENKHDRNKKRKIYQLAYVILNCRAIVNNNLLICSELKSNLLNHITKDLMLGVIENNKFKPFYAQLNLNHSIQKIPKSPTLIKIYQKLISKT